MVLIILDGKGRPAGDASDSPSGTNYALSGSSQHLSGCSGAKNIIAINKNPDANIFNVAQFGVVGDWKQILSPLIKALGDEEKS